MNTFAKRNYNKPLIDVHDIDNEISVFMTSEETVPTDPFAATTQSSQTEVSTLNAGTESNPFTENTFE